MRMIAEASGVRVDGEARNGFDITQHARQIARFANFMSKVIGQRIAVLLLGQKEATPILPLAIQPDSAWLNIHNCPTTPTMLSWKASPDFVDFSNLCGAESNH